MKKKKKKNNQHKYKLVDMEIKLLKEQNKKMLEMLNKLLLDYELVIPPFPRRHEIAKDIESLIKEIENNK